MKPFCLQRRLRRRRCDHRFGVHHEGELARLAVLHEVGVLRRLLARVPGLVADLDAAQPLHPDVAFPARHHEAHRIALLRPQHLAVHAIGDEAIVERLVQRERAGHRGGVGALGQDPLGVRLQARLLEQQLERHAGVLHAMHHAVGVLAAVELGAAPFHAGIGGAFQEMDAVDARQALDVLEREDQRLVDQAVQHQPVIVRIDLGDAAMMALEAQAVGRDDAVELVQRREGDRGLRRRGQPRHRAADHVLLVFRRACHRAARRRRRRDCASSPARWAAGSWRRRRMRRARPRLRPRGRRRPPEIGGGAVVSVGSVIGSSRQMAFALITFYFVNVIRKYPAPK